MSVSSADLPAFKVAISASVSLVVMMVDFVWLIRDEVKYIWPRTRCYWYARFYVLARYIGMSSQIFNVYFTIRMYCGIRTSRVGCSAWFAYQAIVVQFLLVVVEGLLMHRIYALFMKSRMILLVLVMLVVGQAASMMVSARFTLPNVGHTDTCIIQGTPPGNAYFGATTMTTNMIVFFMTFWRYLCLPAKFTRQGLGRVVIRDSTLSLLAISIVMLFLTLSALRIIRPSTAGNITYYWLVCVLWVAIGRIIVNNERLPREDRDLGGSTWRSTLQLTSRIELGEISPEDTSSEGSILSPSNVPARDGIADQESPRSYVSTSDMVLRRPKNYQQGSNVLSCADPGSGPPPAV